MNNELLVNPNTWKNLHEAYRSQLSILLEMWKKEYNLKGVVNER